MKINYQILEKDDHETGLIELATYDTIISSGVAQFSADNLAIVNYTIGKNEEAIKNFIKSIN